jgi:hypothetical protein
MLQSWDHNFSRPIGCGKTLTTPPTGGSQSQSRRWRGSTVEFTLPNDRCKCPLNDTDLVKSASYKSLLDLLAWHLPGWELEIQTYTVGIRGSHDLDRWYAQLRRLEVTAARAERLMQDMVAQAPTELTDLYRESVRYDALQRQQHE